jgi:hypothetical protein
MTLLDQPLVRVCRCGYDGLRCMRMTLDDQPASIKSSCGYAIYPDTDGNPEAVVRFVPWPFWWLLLMLGTVLLWGMLLGRGMRR